MLTTLLLGLSLLSGVSKVENGGLLFTDNQAGVSGTDAGYSLPMGEQTLWMFGDVFLLDPTGPAKNYVGGVSNCGLLVRTSPAPESLRRYSFITDPGSPLARPLLRNAPTEDNHTRLWPFGSWYDASNRKAYLFYGNIKTTGSGAFDFKVAGYGLAAADASNPSAMVFNRLKSSANEELWWKGDDPTLFGAAVVSGNTDGYSYVVGVNEHDGHKNARLARVRQSSIADQKAYTYLAAVGDAPAWSDDPLRACNIEGLYDFPTELSIAYNSYLHGYLAVQSVGVTDHLRLSLASNPWGPYKQIAEIGAPHQAFSKAFCYAGKEHPELAQEHGRIIYVTYVDSQRYWLQLLKITLEK